MHVPNKNLLNKKWLQEQYEIQQRSMRSIATELGVTTAIVSKYIKRYGFLIRSSGESKTKSSLRNGPNYSNDIANNCLLNKTWLEQKYIIEGLSTRQITSLVDLKNRSAVAKALEFHKIPIRSLKEARRNRTKCGRTKKAPNPILLKNKDHIIDSYQSGESIRSIRHRLNLTRDSVYKLLKDNNLYIRDANEARVGSKHSPETIAKMSKTASEQIYNGTRSSHSNGRRVNCLTPNNGFITMRSTWEKKYAEYLKQQGIDFVYEPKPFRLSNGKSYVADFYLPHINQYIEIKGYLSEDQSDKYELFKQEYPDINWKIMHKDNLMDLNIDLKSNVQTIYLLVGAPGAGKSWVANQLTDFCDYVSYDDCSKKEHLELLKKTSSKPKLYDPAFKISTFIRSHSHEFDIKLIAIQENRDVLKKRILGRGGTMTDTIFNRNNAVKKRFDKYGSDGFIGTSEDCLKYLKSVLNDLNDQIEQ